MNAKKRRKHETCLGTYRTVMEMEMEKKARMYGKKTRLRGWQSVAGLSVIILNGSKEYE